MYEEFGGDGKSTVTTVKERQTLALLGFVRVDGLKTTGPLEGDEYIIDPKVKDLGNWGINNGWAVVVTEKRIDMAEVWLCKLTRVLSDWWKKNFDELVGQLCHRGKPGNPSVPCSNGEKISVEDMWNRLADPDWQPRY